MTNQELRTAVGKALLASDDFTLEQIQALLAAMSYFIRAQGYQCENFTNIYGTAAVDWLDTID